MTTPLTHAPLTTEQVWGVAEIIEAEGERPTLERVRARLGRGSMSTISPALRSRKAHKRAGAVSAASPPPPVIGELLNVLGQKVWGAACEHAAGHFVVERGNLQAQIADLETASSETAELADGLNAKLEAAVEQAARLERQARDAHQQATTLEIELAVARQKVGSLEGLEADRRQALDEAKKEIVVLREALGREQAAAQATREQVAHLFGQLEALVKRGT